MQECETREERKTQECQMMTGAVKQSNEKKTSRDVSNTIVENT